MPTIPTRERPCGEHPCGDCRQAYYLNGRPVCGWRLSGRNRCSLYTARRPDTLAELIEAAREDATATY